MSESNRPNSRRAAALLAAILMHFGENALADPPYGEGFDAPASFETAVRIPIGAWHEASFAGPQDSDYYRFDVVEGQSIHVECVQETPCGIALLDPEGQPAGQPSASYNTAGFAIVRIDVANAGAGAWRLEAEGGGDAAYTFEVELAPIAAAASSASGAGAISSWLLGLAALWRLGRRRRWIGVALLAACLGACDGRSPTVARTGTDARQGTAVDDLPETGLQGQVPLTDQLSGRSAQGYRRGVVPVSRNTLDDRGGNLELAWFAQCAYVKGTKGKDATPQDPQRVTVVDLTDPASPEIVGHFGDVLTTLHSLATNEARRLLAASGIVRNADNSETFLLELYDVADCRNPRLLSRLDTLGQNGLSVELTRDGRTAYVAVCCLLNQFASGNYFPDVYSKGSLLAIDLSDAANPRLILKWDAAVPRDRFADIVDLEVSGDGTRAYLAVFGDDDVPNAASTLDVPSGLLVVDTTDIQQRRPDPQIHVIGELYWKPNEHFGQGGSLRLANVKGRAYVIATDLTFFSVEGLVHSNAGCPWTHARLVDVTDERAPRVASEIRLEVNDPANCSATVPDDVYYSAAGSGIDDPHNATLAFFSWFGSGLRIFDIRDPAQPKEIAYYNPPAQPILDPATGQPAGQSDKLDTTVSRIRYQRSSGQIWFVSRNNGFQVVELVPSAPWEERP